MVSFCVSDMSYTKVSIRGGCYRTAAMLVAASTSIDLRQRSVLTTQCLNHVVHSCRLNGASHHVWIVNLVDQIDNFCLDSNRIAVALEIGLELIAEALLGAAGTVSLARIIFEELEATVGVLLVVVEILLILAAVGIGTTKRARSFPGDYRRI